MFVFLFNFIVVFQPYYYNLFTFPSASISYRLLCGQGLIMACIQSAFHKFDLELELSDVFQFLTLF